MARAETIESVGEAGGGGSVPLPRHSTCRMELPRPLHTWPSLLTATNTTATVATDTGTAATHLHHRLHPLLYPLPAEPQTHQRFPAWSPSPAPSPGAPPPPPCSRGAERDGRSMKTSALSDDASDANVEEHQRASRRRGPLPDLLPQNEHTSWASSYHRGPGSEAVPELEVRRVASQLRAIGDQLNATVLRRAHVAPFWQDWRDACWGFLNSITQTLSALHRLT